jgi:hypothetical protein
MQVQPPASSPRRAPPLKKFRIILVPEKKRPSPKRFPVDPEIYLRKDALILAWPDGREAVKAEAACQEHISAQQNDRSTTLSDTSRGS